MPRETAAPEASQSAPSHGTYDEKMIAPASPVQTSTAGDTGAALYDLVAELYPICRSITGRGVQETLQRLQQRVPLTVHQVASGTQVFDWTVPREWNIRDAWIKNAAGTRIVDFHRSNLHVVNYSVPVRKRLSVAELREHLHTLPEHPTWIPYKTSYYKESWGFCLSAEQLASMTDQEYDVCIDSTLEDGHLTYGELYIPGASTDEVLLSCHVCHPSLCNDNLSGISVAVFVARWLAARADRRLSYRFLFIPGTIGSITWLAQNRGNLDRIRHGLVLAGLGGPGVLHYKSSRSETAEIDRAAALVLKHWDEGGEVRRFIPYGYDERQYCSPGINLAVGCLSRTPFGEYPEYHTSADNLDFVRPARLEGAYRACQAILTVLEEDMTPLNRAPTCEPQLGRRGLYSSMGGAGEGRSREMALLWVLNLSDGRHTLVDIAERSGLPFPAISGAAALLRQHGLLGTAASTGSNR
jgi:aminopeptidase-like protein